MSISVKVIRRIQRMKRGVPFSISRFYELGSQTAVQKALSRLCEENTIERVAKGIYMRPKYLPSLPSLKVKASAETVARVWAKEHRYTLVPQGLEAAYRLGLQTQAPMKSILWSDGPNRTFAVGNEVVEVRHVAKQRLRWSRRPEGELLRALSVTPAATVALSDLSKAFKRLGLTNSERHAVVERLKSSSLPKAWQEKLAELETGIPA